MSLLCSLQHSKWRAPDISVFPTNAATNSSNKIDHCGPYANECAAVGEIDNGQQGTKVGERGWVGKRCRGGGKRSGMEEGIK